MPEHTSPSAAVWADEFTKPTLTALLGGLEPEERAAFSAARAALKGERGERDRVEWLGLPWRWAICITRPGIDHPALAYLIAQPGAARACIPVSVDAEIELDSLTKPIRLQLDLAPIIAGYFWPEWPVADLDPVAVRPLLDARCGSAG